MQTSGELRIGIIGLGWPGVQHTKAVLATPGARLAAACDLSAERRTEYRKTFSPRRMYGPYDELLADPEVDAVVVSLPNFLHFPATLAALRAGKHVLCEKPPTLNLAEIETVRDEARARGLTYGFGRQFRFDGPMLAARKAVAAGRLGTVYYARTHWVRQRGVPFGVGGWFTDKARAGGGAMIDIGVHALDAAWFLAGHPRPLSVSAHVGAHFANTAPPGAGFDVDDTGIAFLRFAGGLSVHLEATWAMNLIGGAKPNAWTGLESIDTVLFGEIATLQINPPMVFGVDPRDGRTQTRTPLDIPEVPATQTSFGRQMADFVHAVRTATPPTNSVHQAVDLMRMLMAIYESGATGREVRLDGRENDERLNDE